MMEADNILQKANVINSLNHDQSKNYFVIKSNLMFKYQKVAADEKGFTPNTGQFFCKWCLNAWTSGSYSVALQPEKHPKHHMRSLLRKDFSKLNNFQKKLVVKIKKQSASNSLVFNCKVCTKDTVIILKKPNNGPNEEPINVESIEVKKKKKKKKKDIFAGLNASVVKNYKSSSIKEERRTPEPVRTKPKKPAKKLTPRQQIQIQQALSLASVQKKRPSLLASFLDSM